MIRGKGKRFKDIARNFHASYISIYPDEKNLEKNRKSG